jgi:hypothetical protein
MTATVFGNIPFPGQSGDKFISKAVTGAIAALFKRTDKLEANVKAEPIGKLLQGSIDGFDFVGNGMLMYNGLRLEAMELYLQAISIDFSAIFRGKIKLRQPTQATMRIVLTEKDLISSFNTPFIVEKLQRLTYQNEPLHFQQTEVTLNSDKSLELKTSVKLGKTQEIMTIKVKANLELEGRTKIQFTNTLAEGNEKEKDLAQELIDHVNRLLDLDTFALDGTKLSVDRVRFRDKQLVFYGTADIKNFPER